MLLLLHYLQTHCSALFQGKINNNDIWLLKEQNKTKAQSQFCSPGLLTLSPPNTELSVFSLLNARGRY